MWRFLQGFLLGFLVTAIPSFGLDRSFTRSPTDSWVLWLAVAGGLWMGIAFLVLDAVARGRASERDESLESPARHDRFVSAGLTLLYLVAGGAFVALSGAVESGWPPRWIIANAVIVIVLIRTLYHATAFVVRLAERGPGSRRGAGLLPTFGAMAFAGLLFGGLQIDEAAEKETKRRGDVFLSEMRDYRAIHGECSRRDQDAMPDPAIRGAVFRFYFRECRLTFDAPRFRRCERRTDDAKWICRTYP